MEEFILKRSLKNCSSCELKHDTEIWGFKCPICKALLCAVCWIGDPDSEGEDAYCPVCMGKSLLPPAKENMLILTL